MAYALKKTESVSEGTRRVISKELNKVDHFLSKVSPRRRVPFHEARKSLKKARGALRLVRHSIGEESYRRENRHYRDLARLASEVRDAQVMPLVFDRLLKDYRGKISARNFQSARRHLSHISSQLIAKAMTKKKVFEEARKDVGKYQNHIDTILFQEDGWRGIEPDLQKLYRDAKKGYEHSLENHTDFAFHEWRKSAKYLRHALELMEDAWPDTIKEMTSELHSLGDCLGEDHDLVQLRDTLVDNRSDFGDEVCLRALFALIERQQQSLRERALALGERIFAEKTASFVGRFHQYWKAWRRPEPKPEAHPSLVASH